MFGFQPFAFTPSAGGGGGGGTVITVNDWPVGIAAQTIATPDDYIFLSGQVAGDLIFYYSASYQATSYNNASGNATEIAGTAGGAGGTSLWYSLIYRILTPADITAGFVSPFQDYSAALNWPNGYFVVGSLHRASGSWTGASIFKADNTLVTPVVSGASITNDGLAVAFSESVKSPAPAAYTAVDNGFTNLVTGRFTFGPRSAAAAAYKPVTAGVGISATTFTGPGVIDPQYAMIILFQ